MNEYYTYITCNSSKFTFYIGVTNNLNKRLSQHYEDSIKEKKSFAGKYNCYNLIYFEVFQNVDQAIAREKQLKKWSRAKKENLIRLKNPNLEFLSL
ncbi:GIY-YIG nuclease family protein [Zunongwangia atlantica]|uniref:Excinuclease ABC subunit C n=1 Tax=Zunongwangia atlantica 22II14-10F7 TaxID=1185767 RepID=A0A1Y1T333_9FLAO|nr:GIY-YIG nuclease family protein [Zunongwangia atlantica]ORL44883.1 excinuclease ABC subunit C [Zunongwangia atlantica 22II14-10F7]